MSGYGYPPNQAGYYADSGYPMPQCTQAQLQAYYQQYNQYPPGYYQQLPQPQSIVASTPYAHQPAGTAYDQHATTTSSTLEHGYLTTAHPGSRPRSPRIWKCDFPNCTSTANFTRLADLQRHQSTVHGVGTPEFPCTVKECSRVGEKGFTRRDHLVEHLRNFHHMDIPKRRPGERSAWPMGLGEYM